MEAAILRQLLQASGAFKPSEVAGGQLRADMFIETLADAVAKGGGIGIARMLEDEVGQGDPAGAGVASMTASMTARTIRRCRPRGSRRGRRRERRHDFGAARIVGRHQRVRPSGRSHRRYDQKPHRNRPARRLRQPDPGHGGRRRPQRRPARRLRQRGRARPWRRADDALRPRVAGAGEAWGKSQRRAGDRRGWDRPAEPPGRTFISSCGRMIGRSTRRSTAGSFTGHLMPTTDVPKIR